MSITIKKYEESYKNQWNDFIINSKTNHFMFNRNYMDYHSHRFEDHSLMIFKKNKLIACMPANLENNILYSHKGLSFGGIISTNKIKIQDFLVIFDALKEYCKTNNIKKVIYKQTPAIYDSNRSDEIAYALFYNNATILKCEPNSIIDLQEKISYSRPIVYGINKSKKLDITIKRNDNNYQEFYENLKINLSKFNKTPVHTLDEFILLANRFPQNIELISAYYENTMTSSTWIFKTNQVIHTQNIVSTPHGRKIVSGALLFDHIIQDSKDKFKFFSFGISSEDNGRYLNIPLISNKGYYGSRIQNIYTYELII